MIALTLAAVGAVLLVTAAYLLMTSKPATAEPLGPCVMPSPDNQPCTGTLGHVGWHRHQGLEWFGDAWQLPTGTVQAPAAIPDGMPVETAKPQLNRYIAVAACLITGVITVITALMIHDAPAPPPADRHANCAYHWEDAYPGHGLCPDSPDNRPGPARTGYDGRLVDEPR